MKLSRLNIDPTSFSKARADLATLNQITATLQRSMVQGVIEAYREARNLRYVDPDEVMTELEAYFEPGSAWNDMLTDALWTFQAKCADEGNVGLSTSSKGPL